MDNKFYFKSEKHFENFLERNGELNSEAKNIIKAMYRRAEKNETFYRELLNVFTYNFRNKNFTSEETIKNIFCILKKEKEIDRLKLSKDFGYVRGYDFKEFFKYCFDGIVTKEFEEVINILEYECGLYFLYDENKKLIYIGKSKNLASRIPTSIKDRKAFYMKFKLCYNLSDMHILELYYISKLKPKLNSDCSETDVCTFEIQHNFKDESDFIKIIEV